MTASLVAGFGLSYLLKKLRDKNQSQNTTEDATLLRSTQSLRAEKKSSVQLEHEGISYRVSNLI